MPPKIRILARPKKDNVDGQQQGDDDESQKKPQLRVITSNDNISALNKDPYSPTEVVDFTPAVSPALRVTASSSAGRTTGTTTTPSKQLDDGDDDFGDDGKPNVDEGDDDDDDNDDNDIKNKNDNKTKQQQKKPTNTTSGSVPGSSDVPSPPPIINACDLCNAAAHDVPEHVRTEHIAIRHWLSSIDAMPEPPKSAPASSAREIGALAVATARKRDGGQVAWKAMTNVWHQVRTAVQHQFLELRVFGSCIALGHWDGKGDVDLCFVRKLADEYSVRKEQRMAIRKAKMEAAAAAAEAEEEEANKNKLLNNANEDDAEEYRRVNTATAKAAAAAMRNEVGGRGAIGGRAVSMKAPPKEIINPDEPWNTMAEPKAQEYLLTDEEAVALAIANYPAISVINEGKEVMTVARALRNVGFAFDDLEPVIRTRVPIVKHKNRAPPTMVENPWKAIASNSRARRLRLIFRHPNPALSYMFDGCPQFANGKGFVVTTNSTCQAVEVYKDAWLFAKDKLAEALQRAEREERDSKNNNNNNSHMDAPLPKSLQHQHDDDDDDHHDGGATTTAATASAASDARSTITTTSAAKSSGGATTTTGAGGKDADKREPTMLERLRTITKGQFTHSLVSVEWDSNNFYEFPEMFHCDFDLSFRSHGIRNSLLLRAYFSQSPLARVGAALVKQWSKDTAINLSMRGYWTTYCVNIVWLHFLVTRKVVKWVDPLSIPVYMSDEEFEQKCLTYLPTCGDNVETDADVARLEQEVGDLLFDFFRFYGYEFNWDFFVVTLRQEKPFLRTDVSTQVDPWVVDNERRTGHFRDRVWYRLCIDDPYEPNLSLGRHLSPDKASRIIGHFRWMAQALAKERTTPASCSNDNHSHKTTVDNSVSSKSAAAAAAAAVPSSSSSAWAAPPSAKSTTTITAEQKKQQEDIPLLMKLTPDELHPDVMRHWTVRLLIGFRDEPVEDWIKKMSDIDRHKLCAANAFYQMNELLSPAQCEMILAEPTPKMDAEGILRPASGPAVCVIEHYNDHSTFVPAEARRGIEELEQMVQDEQCVLVTEALLREKSINFAGGNFVQVLKTLFDYTYLTNSGNEFRIFATQNALEAYHKSKVAAEKGATASAAASSSSRRKKDKEVTRDTSRSTVGTCDDCGKRQRRVFGSTNKKDRSRFCEDCWDAWEKDQKEKKEKTLQGGSAAPAAAVK